MAHTKKKTNFLWIAGIVFFSLMLILSAVMLWRVTAVYRQEAEVSRATEIYRPTLPAAPVETAPAASVPSAGEDPTAPAAEPTEPAVVNEPLLEAQALNPDVRGWLTLPGTRVDYIFVQGSDNRRYLYRDVYGNSASAGTIFMDYRCDPEFGGFNTILFGHHMNNGSMLADLDRYRDEDFFQENSEGLLFLPYANYRLELFACMVVRADDPIIYNTDWSDAADQEEFLRYLRCNADHYRELGVTTKDRFITLSTCAYVFEGARTVLVGRIVPA